MERAHEQNSALSTGFKYICILLKKTTGSIPDGGQLRFLFELIFWPHYGPEVYSASNWNEYERYLLGVKAAGQPLPPLFAGCLQIQGALNFWNPQDLSRPVKGFALLRFAKKNTMGAAHGKTMLQQFNCCTVNIMARRTFNCLRQFEDSEQPKQRIQTD